MKIMRFAVRVNQTDASSTEDGPLKGDRIGKETKFDEKTMQVTQYGIGCTKMLV